MFEGPYTLEAPGWQDYCSMEVDLGRGDGIFADEKALPIGVTIRNKGLKKIKGNLYWTIDNDEFKTLKKLDAAVTIRAGKAKTIHCAFAPTAPGFYRINGALQVEGSEHAATVSKIIGLRPEEIHTPLTEQDDFDAFWEKMLKELAAIKPQYKMIRHPEHDTHTHEVYEVEMRSLNNVRVRGWYEKPKAKGVFPALLIVPGYTMDLEPTGTSDPLAVFSFNVRAHGNSTDDYSDEPEDMWLRGLDHREGYFYQGAVADCIRAMDFIASRSEIDIKRVAITGESQGGGLSFVTAALDHRISFCAPVIPFMTDYVRYFKTSKWPDMEEWIAAEPHRTWESTLQTLSYFDLLNMIDRFHVPVFVGIGLQDDTCPPGAIFSVYNRLDVPKKYYVYPHAKHWVDASHYDLQRAWLNKHLGIE
jgi:cephalosporin-C deacetylase-like acetyl esterase